MGRVERFEDLDIWKDARSLVSDIYSLSRENEELSRDYGFRNQLQRAAVSIMNNIAEGFERDGDSSFKHFLNFSKSSCGEVRSMIYLAKDLSYMEEDEADRLIKRLKVLSRKISSLMKYLGTSS
ncbi:four helix bundle protein [Aliifodinibius sp. S!AR15-10]|uniref:four helix bundle protein n=1 Tax=Aliifodinibius sp. S!AR15-10 TaxID=2950437 RepID=UPI00285F1AB2|nr:four helix bundle protein [Aliifodinibius sp. S!AR15-10]MDR8393402.1 four helix bundle protein [Aliifodinibius sp. S!AR15-10]